VAIVSLARPERESFDSRARILFRRQTGKHIDYIVSRIKEILEHYAEQTENKITILDFNAAEKKFRISSSGNTIVRSYLDDVESTYVSEIHYASDTPPPDSAPRHRLVYARVGGNPIGTSEEFTGTITRPIACRIDRDGTCTVSTLSEFWLRANDEDNTHTPKRYTQVMRWLFENLVSSNQDIEIKYTLDGKNWVSQRLTHGGCGQVIELKDLKPGEVAFNYRILAP
jgi:hypothetical protein